MTQKESHDELNMRIKFADALALVRRFNRAQEEVNAIILLHPSLKSGASRYLRRLIMSQLSQEDKNKIRCAFNELISCYREWVDVRDELTALVETEPGQSLAVELGLARMSFGRVIVNYMPG